MLKGRVVSLRPFRADDLPIMRDWFRDPETARAWGRAPIVADDAFESDLTGKFKQFGESGYFAIDNDEGNFIGRAEFEHLDPIDRAVEVMIMLGNVSSRDKGAGTDALITLLHHLFLDRQVERVWLTVLVWNVAAIRTYEKVGFVHEGRFVEDCWIDGELHDQFVMGILREEFEAKWPVSRLVAE